MQHRRTVVITGANRGLGLELVRQYAARGDRVIAATRRTSDELDAVGATQVTLDLLDDASIATAAATIAELAPRIDVLINNAGVAHGGEWERSENFGTLDADAMGRVIRVNTLGPLVFSQRLMPQLRAAAPTAVLAGISSYFSVLSDRGPWFANNFGYSMSKVSLNMWLRSVAVLMRGKGVRTVVLDPGWVRTEMGGNDAPLEPRDVAAGAIRVINELTDAQSGTYLSWDGKPVPW